MMKKLILTFTVVLALTVTLAGCALMEPESTPAPTATPKVVVSASPEASPSPAPEAEPSPTPEASPSLSPEPAPQTVSENDIVEAFEKMNEFRMFWYAGGNSSAATGDEFTVDGKTCCTYETEDVKTFEDLKNLALTMVTEALFEEFQSGFTYFDKDGSLCGPVGYGAGDNTDFVGSECEFVKISDTEYELKAGQYFNLGALSEGDVTEKSTLVGEYTCRYALVDGKWLFTSLSYERKDAAAG